MIREQIEAKMILSEVHFMLFAQPVYFCWMSLSKEPFLLESISSISLKIFSEKTSF